MAKKKKRRVAGLPPGSLVYTGHRAAEGANVSLIQYNQEILHQDHAKDTYPEYTPNDQLTTWFDVRGVHDINLIQKLGERFQIHSLVLEDILDTDQRPKFEEYKNGIFLTLRALHFDTQRDRLETEQIAIFLGNGFVLSFQERPGDMLKPVRDRIIQSSGKIRQRGADYLAYALADNVVDHYFFALDQVEELLENTEEEVLKNPDAQSKGKIHKIKLQTLILRKSISPLREAIGRFSKADNPFVSDNTVVFTRDLYDHTIQILDMVDTYRDMATSLYDLYVSEISFRMNNVMKVLTIISTIFIPLTFIAGVYGMNFKYMPELEWRYGYAMAWGVMVLIFLASLWFFRNKRWL